MEVLYLYGPVSICIDASEDAFQSYTTGVYSSQQTPVCPANAETDHAVLLTGWGVSNGVKYWNVKNQWGSGWGNKGYIWIARDTTNNCGISSNANMVLLK